MKNIDKPDRSDQPQSEEKEGQEGLDDHLESELSALEKAKETASEAVSTAESISNQAREEVGSGIERIDTLSGTTEEELDQARQAGEKFLKQVNNKKSEYLNEFTDASPDVLRARVNEAAFFLQTVENPTAETLEEEFALDPETARTYFNLAQAFAPKGFEETPSEEKPEENGEGKEEKGYPLEGEEKEEGQEKPNKKTEEDTSAEETDREADVEDKPEIDSSRIENDTDESEKEGDQESSPEEEIEEDEMETEEESRVESELEKELSLREIGRERISKIGGLFSRTKEKLKSIGRAGAEYVMAAPEVAKRSVEVGIGAGVLAYEKSRDLALDARDRLALEVNMLIQKGVEAVEKAKQAVIDAKDTTIEFGNRALYRAAERISRPFVRFQARRMEGTVKYLANRASRGKIKKEDLERAQKLLDHLKGLEIE